MPPIHIDEPPSPERRNRANSLALAEGPPRAITYLRVSVTDRCNLRCAYCMPEDQDFLDRDGILSFEEITRVAQVLVRHGVNKIRLTGGEPLLRRDLPALVAMLKNVAGAPQVVLTTNGMLLDRQAQALKAAGLDRLNVSLDTLRPDRFERLARRPGLEHVLAGLRAAQAAGFTRTKLNMVVMGGVNEDEIPALLDFAAAGEFELRFLEFMPMTSNEYGLNAERVPLHEIRQRVEACVTLERRPRGSGPAETFRVAETGAAVGFIAAISLPFCETCNRVRLTSEGVLRSCLFEGGEVSIRELLRSGTGIETGLEQALDYLRRVKPPVHDGLGHVQMNQVGG
ncbi:MAG: GTP 3',8-cyclase MoaA [Planctomycetota bacterium]